MSDNNDKCGLRYNSRVVKVELYVNTSADIYGLITDLIQLSKGRNGDAAYAKGRSYYEEEGEKVWKSVVIKNETLKEDFEEEDDTVITVSPSCGYESDPVEREYYMLRDKKTGMWHNYGSRREWTPKHEGGYIWTIKKSAEVFAESFPKDVAEMEVVPVIVLVK